MHEKRLESYIIREENILYLFSMKFITALMAIFFIFTAGNIYAGEVPNAGRSTIISDSKKTTVTNLSESAQYEQLEKMLTDADVEKKLLEVRQTINENNSKTLDRLITLVGWVITILGIIIAGGFFLNYNSIVSMRKDSEKFLEKLEKEVKSTLDKNIKFSEELGQEVKSELDNKLKDHVDKIVNRTMEGIIEKPLLELSERVNALENDIKDSKRPELIKYSKEKKIEESKSKNLFDE